jgi:hypothetical protein
MYPKAVKTIWNLAGALLELTIEKTSPTEHGAPECPSLTALGDEFLEREQGGRLGSCEPLCAAFCLNDGHLREFGIKGQLACGRRERTDVEPIEPQVLDIPRPTLLCSVISLPSTSI